MKTRNVVRLRSGLSYSGFFERESPLSNHSLDFSLCVVPNEKVAIKILIPQNEIESIFRGGIKYVDHERIKNLHESEE